MSRMSAYTFAAIGALRITDGQVIGPNDSSFFARGLGGSLLMQKPIGFPRSTGLTAAVGMLAVL
jgi:hypothetical protein